MIALSCPPMTGVVSPKASIGFLGPPGTFTEEALIKDPGLAEAKRVPLPSFVDVLAAVAEGAVDFGFVAIENSIEGTVSIAMDLLVFDHELQIVGEASDGLEAVRKAEELKPDLIVLDIGLPTLNGIEVARRIRKLCPECRILFLSQESSADVAQEAAFRNRLLQHRVQIRRRL